MNKAEHGIEQWQLYVLQLEDDKWYVGVTGKTPHEELARHKAGNGGDWTHKHKPSKVQYAKDFGAIEGEKAREFEDRVTVKYMEKYGVGNVFSDNMATTHAAKAKSDTPAKGSKKLLIINRALMVVSVVLLLGVGYLLFDKFYWTPSLQTFVYQ